MSQKTPNHRKRKQQRMLRKAVNGAIEVLHTNTDQQDQASPATNDPLQALLDTYQELIVETGEEAEAEAQPQPVRTIHHLACTGGTLISRCLAAQPNTNVLSEVDPLSPFVPGGFLPTDIIGLSRFSSRPAAQEIQIKLFLAGLEVLCSEARRQGQHLILRDHSHGHFNFGDAIAKRPSLREIVSRVYPVKSLITVRHPFDSYLSLLENGWVVHFSPQTLSEYAIRYHAFLDHYSDCELIRYEDFVATPEAKMQQICAILDLQYNPDFAQAFPCIELSGDIGRRGDLIEPRPRRPQAPAIEQEARHSDPFMSLLYRLKYNFENDSKTESR